MLLKKGSYGNDVKEAKKLLNNHFEREVLDPRNPNFGVTMEEFVKKYQRDKGLISDGIIGPLTWKVQRNSLESTKHPFTLREHAVHIAMTQVGVKEETGKNDGEEVEEYLSSIKLGAGYAWCQAFVFWCFTKAADLARVPNPVPLTGGVLDAKNKSKEYALTESEKIEKGDVFSMNFGKGTGHTGIVLSVEGDFLTTIEGNTSADPVLPSEDREGQGVFIRRRHKSTINNGYIRYRSSGI